MNKNIEIISLIFKSKDYLRSIINEFLQDYSKSDGWDVGYRIVANDATPEVIAEMKKYEKELPDAFRMDYYNNPSPEKFYMKRVYDAWNYCVESTEYDNVCLTGSDHIWSSDWLDNLLKHHDGVSIPCCRLVESGKMPSGKYAVNAMRELGYNFGYNVRNFPRKKWEEYATGIKEDSHGIGGLYMPVVFKTTRFLEAGGYESEKYSVNPYFMPDTKLFEKLISKYEMRHITIFDSLVYHIQEGEKDE